MKYQDLLLDADGTLLDFHKAEAQGFASALKMHGLPFSQEILELYSGINKKCWEEFEQGLITKETLLIERFRRLFEQLGISADADVVRRTYQEELGKGAFLIEGALELCKRLAKTYRLFILTNGVSVTQHSRFAKSGLDKIVQGVFVSEDIGYQKPQKEYFEAVFDRIPGFDRKRALMVGDSLSADMTGGIRAGVDTCWYNPEGLERPSDMKITYMIRQICDLETVLEQNG